MMMHDGYPVLENINAQRHGFATRLVPILTDGLQTGWEEVHHQSRLQVVTRTSPAAHRAAGHAAPFTDYDPILQDMERQRARSACRPVWMGD
jgi:hypothetical protein